MLVKIKEETNKINDIVSDNLKKIKTIVDREWNKYYK